MADSRGALATSLHANNYSSQVRSLIQSHCSGLENFPTGRRDVLASRRSLELVVLRSENDQGTMNLASNTAELPSTARPALPPISAAPDGSHRGANLIGYCEEKIFYRRGNANCFSSDNDFPSFWHQAEYARSGLQACWRPPY